MNKQNPAILAGILTTHLRQAYPGRNFSVKSVSLGWTSYIANHVYFVVSENGICLASSKTISTAAPLDKNIQEVIKDFKDQPDFLNPTLGEEMAFVKRVLAEEFPAHQFTPVLLTPQADSGRMVLVGYDLKCVLEITGKNPDGASSTVRIGMAAGEPPHHLRSEIIAECNAILGKPFE